MGKGKMLKNKVKVRHRRYRSQQKALCSPLAILLPNMKFKAMTELSTELRHSITLTICSAQGVVVSGLLEAHRVLLRESKKDFGRSLTVLTRSCGNMELYTRDAVLDK